mmetsp:Transcript_91377/g.263758  ORF Transcript_91377/g.263758 Transcript_91377/m.263758 type:complete len:202 (-) Transcript_91377:475-1080(-)|eukprot:CAMPEP_0176008924 /NCGR_PEP_ID=MMETSP0120_2-20121206/3989_1 /TAXON_ID=160619 /ORGANISM="Kryptoperidinium foliaceum, Strain CCMP 1326" /LENGTH=201 /DNA_ID=CAMNT_0017341711 /DNA_START=216 /DNA_END=824 /DNA_ORIENTATION=+
MATVSCKCGKIKFQLGPSKAPRVHSLCCCDDCQRRVEHLTTKGGTAFDTSRPVEVANFEGQVKLLDPQVKNLLYVFKLRDETNMVNVASKCCYSFLCARNTDFHGNAIATFPQYAIVNDAEEISKPYEFLSFPGFWKHGDLRKDLPQFWKDGTKEGGFDGTGDFMTALGTAMGANAAPMTETVEGAISFDELVEGQEIHIV